MNRKPQINRRDLLRGKLWKLVGDPIRAPRVMRYPKTLADIDPSPSPRPSEPVRSIGGISIDPVGATAFSATTRARDLPLFRPPGAVEESQFMAGCTRCGDCVTACPHDAIKNAPSRFGGAVGTPVIEADTAACVMCEDYPCITSCKPGVLVDSIPIRIGTALITGHLCSAYHGTSCTVCSEECPVDNAITISDGRPVINEDQCTGCGVCRNVCPAPENAILLMPTFSRPAL